MDDTVRSTGESPVPEPLDPPEFEPYDPPAGGWGALRAVSNMLREQSVAVKAARAARLHRASVRHPERIGRRVLPRDELAPALAWHDPKSKTPAAKSIPVIVRAQRNGG
jgi:hypothetical protein